MNKYEYLIDLLDSFDAHERRSALKSLLATRSSLLPEPGTNVNMHYHSFFSYNAEGYSPSHIAWAARKAGLYAAGLCDFDVLDGLNEFLEAGLLVGLRSTVNLETRAFFREYADVDISSPGEAGVTYIMGGGFFELPDDGSEAAKGLAFYRDGAANRNVALIERINAKLPDIAIDYETEVKPLTPSGSATERHIISAYLHKSKSVFEHPEPAARFWAPILGKDSEETLLLMADVPAMEEAVRAKLVKRGGIGYEQPSSETFPTVDDFIKWVLFCKAIPMVTWLDGTSPGEADARVLMECLTGKGAAALNIIPDRNWNISDAETKALKTRKLKEIIEAAEAMDVPVNIGTEMNKLGLPFHDDLDGEALRPYKPVILKGANIMVGHTVLAKYADFPYLSDKAGKAFKSAAAKNEFFESAGKLPALKKEDALRLEDMGPDKALVWFFDRIKEENGNVRS